MTSSGQIDTELLRLRVIALMMLSAFLFLGAVLARIQVADAGKYRTSLDRQSIRRVRLPGTRGTIFDRNGIRLADNRPSYCIAVYLEELRKAGRWERTVEAVESVVAQVAEIVGVPSSISREDLLMHIRKRLPLPLLAWRDLDARALARWEERGGAIPGVDVYVEPVRQYPFGAIGSHLLGYVGRAEHVQDLLNPYHFYLPEMDGDYGVERECNSLLAGTAGGRLLRVDASGYKHEEVSVREATAGQDVRLTTDIRIQKAAEDILDGLRGAVVVMDPRNGDLLAMASVPTFDPNRFSTGISRQEWRALLADEDKPLFNRAISGTYPPGSIFKPVVALAALEGQRATAATSFSCPGYYALGSVRFNCWHRQGHGMLAMRKGIEQSCNAYFCNLGMQSGHERIIKMADSIGLGKKTGVDLAFESGGLLPDGEWKKRVYRDAWRSGDTCNMSIGQGALLVTPLQMAVYVSALANGGQIYRPRILMEPDAGGGSPGKRVYPGELLSSLGWAVSSLQVVRGGMLDVIQAPQGTGKRARIEGVEMAGKTGTAEYGVKAAGKKHAWMILFAPYSEPRYAVSMIVEDAMSGGFTVAPLLADLMTKIFELEKEPTGS